MSVDIRPVERLPGVYSSPTGIMRRVENDSEKDRKPPQRQRDEKQNQEQPADEPRREDGGKRALDLTA